ncbi:MAG TPA: ATP-binding protein [Polyangiaceae bacterium]|nr:ATP-binding protein [Polyangiaceae bacterium]
MSPERQGISEEIRSLQACLNDLMSVVTLPALWSGLEFSQIVGTFLESVLGMLGLDFAYVRTIAAADSAQLKTLRASPEGESRTPESVGDQIRSWLSSTPAGSPRPMPNPVGAGEVTAVYLRLGVHDELGTLVVGSSRAGFPTRSELLVLQVAANQVAIGLLEARRFDEQRRTAGELERRVNERTKELLSLNEQLRREIAERERTEQERMKLASIVEHSSDFIGMASLQGHCLFLNPAGRRLVGLDSGSDVQSKHITDFVVAGEIDRLMSEATPTALEQGSWKGELLFRNLETGAAIPMSQHLFVIREPRTGDPIGFATISRDITQERRAEEALRVAREELARVSRVLTMGELAGSIAHEVNQPLTAVVASAGACVRWLAAEPPNVAEARAAAGCVKQDATRASDVIQRIRALFAGDEPSQSVIPLNEAIRDAVSVIEGEARAQGVTVKASVAPDVPMVVGDRIQLQQVILNLALNAVEAMKSVVNRPRLLEIGAQTDGPGKVRVLVRDSGPGLSTAERNRVFDAFYTTKARGMGMGLAICRSIVDAHGGKLWATANPDSGETFQFTFPGVQALSS